MSPSYRRKGAVLGSVLAGFVGQAALALSGPLTARMLGVTGRGQLALVFLFIAITSLLGGLGLPTAVTFLLAKSQATAAGALWRFRGHWFLLCVSASLGCTSAILLYQALTGALHGIIVPTLLLSFPAVGLSMTLQLAIGCLQGEMRFSALSVLRVLPAALTAGAVTVVYLTNLTRSVPVLLSLSVGASFISSLLSIIIIFRPKSPALKGGALRLEGRQLARYGLRALLGASSPIDSLSLDQAFVGLLLSPRLLGLYVVAGAFANLPTLVLQSVGLLALPRVAAIGDATLQRQALNRVILASAILSAIVCVVVESVLQPFLTFAFGRPFLAALPIGRVLVAGGFFLGMRRLFTTLLQAVNRPGRASFGEALGVGALIVTLAPGVALLQDIGAALAISFSGFVTATYMLVALRKVDAKEPLLRD